MHSFHDCRMPAHVYARPIRRGRRFVTAAPRLKGDAKRQDDPGHAADRAGDLDGLHAVRNSGLQLFGSADNTRLRHGHAPHLSGSNTQDNTGFEREPMRQTAPPMRSAALSSARLFHATRPAGPLGPRCAPDRRFAGRPRRKLSPGGSIYDPNDPMGTVFFSILATFAEFEAGLLKLRTREGMTLARAKGRSRARSPNSPNASRPSSSGCTAPASTPSPS